MTKDQGRDTMLSLQGFIVQHSVNALGDPSDMVYCGL